MKNRAFMPLPLKPQVVPGFARLVGQGLQTLPEAVAACLAEAHKMDPEWNLSGLQARITWELADAVRAYRGRIADAERQLKRLVRGILCQGGDARPELARRHIEMGEPLAAIELLQILANETELHAIRRRHLRTRLAEARAAASPEGAAFNG